MLLVELMLADKSTTSFHIANCSWGKLWKWSKEAQSWIHVTKYWFLVSARQGTLQYHCYTDPWGPVKFTHLPRGFLWDHLSLALYLLAASRWRKIACWIAWRCLWALHASLYFVKINHRFQLGLLLYCLGRVSHFIKLLSEMIND